MFATMARAPLVNLRLGHMRIKILGAGLRIGNLIIGRQAVCHKCRRRTPRITTSGYVCRGRCGRSWRRR
ncbi:hypothetical protein ARTHRO9V_160181 [Arthrobacter sp. 9V]|nr:hypothetical protein ARTHRO9V_160181 [Arthrobacter sp. 9V]